MKFLPLLCPIIIIIISKLSYSCLREDLRVGLKRERQVSLKQMAAHFPPLSSSAPFLLVRISIIQQQDTSQWMN